MHLMHLMKNGQLLVQMLYGTTTLARTPLAQACVPFCMRLK